MVQAASSVVLAECDLAQLDAMNHGLLFVDLTQAQVHLEWVISGSTALLVEQAVQS
ncbi:MAG: hypothetical protein Q7K57_56590 [Burkholderiaceae bacterium]|nr:hypothetical protein [Burkholderiaceae bacterium]